MIDDEGHLLTNAHVVEGADEVQVKLGGEDGETLDAKVVGRDPSTDVALLEVDPPEGGLQALELADSEGVAVGDPAVAIGNPFGLDNTATAGIVSAIQREISAPNGFTISDAIQTDAPINPGNSGGPLLDAAGRVIGINSQIEAAGGQGNVGIGFAVPINTAQGRRRPAARERRGRARRSSASPAPTSRPRSPTCSTCRSMRARWSRRSSPTARPRTPASRAAAPRSPSPASR